ncbi:hypothetical protein G167_gp46 [Burkholderia phage BcepMigl]|uniref:Uncharacterized protein n=1 Tax=Burkholderia phage BcepMigl TaxID=2886899 RepID=I6WLP2_9CAUD|nr:hypothetical protein G167_gp46 [Burkholderia phage BcepMigl]AFN39108.1 hypothetical protein BcepMigl_gp39 [Burkholderia phage BcepMigl]
MKFEPSLSHTIIVLATKYLLYTCVNPWMPEERRTWVYRGEVDLSAITLL